ncbi:preprotein translocase subunit YajC [Nocardioides caeni]|uniref:preprotein translocase subunit YajC n=1 Tax=Nocardioides caeni TaxID=574700 RepID=UPI001EE956C7|nr:preprotein translocase subunit YajC [Nocardioides caeni]
MENAASLLPIVAIAVIFWLLIIRPASRQRKAAADLQAALSVGDDVMLTSGILGSIVGTDGEHLELEIAPGVVIQVMRGAVASVRRDVVDEVGEVEEDAAGSSDEGISLAKDAGASTDNTTEER